MSEKIIPTASFEYQAELWKSKITNIVLYNAGIPMLRVADDWYQFDLANYVYDISEDQEGMIVNFRKRNNRMERAKVDIAQSWDVNITKEWRKY